MLGKQEEVDICTIIYNVVYLTFLVNEAILHSAHQQIALREC